MKASSRFPAFCDNADSEMHQAKLCVGKRMLPLRRSQQQKAATWECKLLPLDSDYLLFAKQMYFNAKLARFCMNRRHANL
jgi:hypothetical protein